MSVAETTEYWKRGDAIAIYHTNVKDVYGAILTSFTGYQFHATLKANRDDIDADAIAELNTSDFTTAVTGTTSNSAVAHMKTNSLSLTLGNEYYLDAQIVDPNSNPATVLSRIIIFEQDTTTRIVDT